MPRGNYGARGRYSIASRAYNTVIFARTSERACVQGSTPLDTIVSALRSLILRIDLSRRRDGVGRGILTGDTGERGRGIHLSSRSSSISPHVETRTCLTLWHVKDELIGILERHRYWNTGISSVTRVVCVCVCVCGESSHSVYATIVRRIRR